MNQNLTCNVANMDKPVAYAIGTSLKKSFKEILASSIPSSQVDINLEKKNILIVEDFPIVLEYLTHIFRRIGYRVTVASTAKEAILKYSESVDLIFLKIKLPDMEGRELIQKIREKQELYKKSPAPIIANIATTDNGNSQDWVALGAKFVFSSKDSIEKNDFIRLLQK